MPRGCFIVFCGLDGSRKSTHLEGTKLWLDEHNLSYTQGRHPREQWFNDPAIYGKYVLGHEEDMVDDYFEVDFTCGLRREIQALVENPSISAGRDTLTSLFFENQSNCCSVTDPCHTASI